MRRSPRAYVPTLDLLTSAIWPVSTTTVRSGGFDVFQGWERSIWVQLNCTGTPDVKVSYEVAYWDEATNTFSDYVAPPNGGVLSSGITDKNLHVFSLNPPACASCKIVFEGQGSNPADTAVTVLKGSWGVAEG